ncbi:hypothetical protein LO762_14810 [Actinocorallia sp. API 0066]|uniref:hypothetical protein n=1 Tax=Actinocorallia sp. API 0066 TaxID=2896846 RepID=UPI001E5883E8|nr:hypothetical protein [Actinocorallia sp. API 0066]MCD0450451.1 hypothetical protein [Actinocorallia sp. API 0066]
MNIGRGLAVLLCAGLLTGCAFQVEPRQSTGQSTPGKTDDRDGQSQGEQGRTPPKSTSGTRRVVLADPAGGLPLIKDSGGLSDVPFDPGEIRQNMNLVMGKYLPPTGTAADAVLVVAVDGVPEDASQRREHLWRGLLDMIGWTEGASAGTFDAGPLGGSVECFLASLAETGQAVCGWADASTAGVALFPNSDLPTAARTFTAMRADLER